MNIRRIFDSITLDSDKQVTFFRLRTWDKADLHKALLNDVCVNQSKIKKFESWMKEMRKKEKAKFDSKKTGK